MPTRLDAFVETRHDTARSEWRLITATHNLQKLHRYQLAAAAA
jgi:hypothetical protein